MSDSPPLPGRGILAGLLTCWVLTASPPATAGDGIRVALFNVQELDAAKIDRLDADGHGADPQLLNAARIVARVRPDVLVLNEIDYSPERDLAQLFLERYLDPVIAAEGREPLSFPHRVYLPVNTGVLSGLDLNRDGALDSPEDAWGFGRYPGQYGMAVVSRLPVLRERLRTFQGLRWVTLPGHLMPDGRDGRPEWYSAEAAAVLRLSSKSHWDVPLDVGGKVLHLLVSHPTPPVFDGDEDRNGRRNHDEIRLWADYVSTAAGDPTTYLVDDQGRRGGLGDEPFVILGDQNADPYRPGPLGPPSIRQLLEHPRIQDPGPRSEGISPRRSGAEPYPGEDRQRTSAYGRLDYVLPSRDLEVLSSGVFMPPEGHPDRDLVVGDQGASDHRMVWLDLSRKGLQ